MTYIGLFGALGLVCHMEHVISQLVMCLCRVMQKKFSINRSFAFAVQVWDVWVQIQGSRFGVNDSSRQAPAVVVYLFRAPTHNTGLLSKKANRVIMNTA